MKTTITKKMATSLLLKNSGNRSLNVSHVKFLAKQMAEGDWIYNGQPIIIDSNGDLMDGQHRLEACVLSGKSFVTELIEGIDDAEAFFTIDTGRLRSASDALGIEGRKNTAYLAAISKHFILWNECDDKREFALVGRKRSNKEISRAADLLIDKIGEDRVCCLINKVQKFSGTSVVMFGAMLANQASPEKTDQFLNAVGSVLFSSERDPRKRFYHYLELWKCREKTTTSKTNLLKAFSKSFNAFLENRQIGRLQVKDGEKLAIIKQEVRD